MDQETKQETPTRHPLELLNDAVAVFVTMLNGGIVRSDVPESVKFATLVCAQELMAGVLGTGAAAFGPIEPAWKVEPAVMQATQLLFAEKLMEVASGEG